MQRFREGSQCRFKPYPPGLLWLYTSALVIVSVLIGSDNRLAYGVPVVITLISETGPIYKRVSQE